MFTAHTRNASVCDETTLERIITNVLISEANAIHAVIDETRESLAAAVNLVFQASGPLIVSGIVKSGHIARKIASTFRSLGKRAAFLHAAALREDLTQTGNRIEEYVW